MVSITAATVNIYISTTKPQTKNLLNILNEYSLFNF